MTLQGEGRSILIEKRSRFIGNACPVTTKEDAVDYINSIKNEYKDASHNVGAYFIRTGNLSHSSDDGEPSGTAGVPVLETLTKAKIVDAAVVVTRYFGGTLLGAGGLIRAYSSTASSALRDAKIAIMTCCVVYDLVVDYSMYERLLQLLEAMSIIVESRQFTDRVTLRCITKKSCEDTLVAKLGDFFRGETRVKFVKETFLPLEVE